MSFKTLLGDTIGMAAGVAVGNEILSPMIGRLGPAAVSWIRENPGTTLGLFAISYAGGMAVKKIDEYYTPTIIANAPRSDHQIENGKEEDGDSYFNESLAPIVGVAIVDTSFNATKQLLDLNQDVSADPTIFDGLLNKGSEILQPSVEDGKILRCTKDILTKTVQLASEHPLITAVVVVVIGGSGFATWKHVEYKRSVTTPEDSVQEKIDSDSFDSKEYRFDEQDFVAEYNPENPREARLKYYSKKQKSE